ncbi:uncharacterized protein [Hyperolius riggenbachi]|uniref:uncharacterized protein n=1 Tax=Hyperolius riggenbachi TaxID=752182 RepID=UPI0035A3BCF2
MNPTANPKKRRRVRSKKTGIKPAQPGQKGLFGQQGQKNKIYTPSLRTLQWKLKQQYNQITQGAQGEQPNPPGQVNEQMTWRQRIKKAKQEQWLKQKQQQLEQKQGQQQGKQKKKGAKALPKDKDEDKCTVCYLEVAPKDRFAHNQTELHREMVEFRDQCRWEASRCKTKTLMDIIEKTDLEKNRSVPFVGLEYIREFLPNESGEHVYDCKLCTGTFRPKTMFHHIQSNKHRILYLARHHKTLGIDRKFRVTDLDKWKQLITLSAVVEKLSGRRELIVMNRIYYTNLTPEQVSAFYPRQDALPSECDDGESSVPPVQYPVQYPSTPVQTSNAFKQGIHAERKQAFQQNALVPRFGPAQDMRRPFQVNTSPGRAMGWDSRPLQQSQPPVDDSTPSMSAKELLLLRSFVEARSKLQESSGGAMFHDGNRPKPSQMGPVMQHVADIEEPAGSHQSTVISRSTVDIRHTVGKGGTSVHVVSVQQSTVSTVGQQRPAVRYSKVPFTKGDRGRTFRELKEANEAQMRLPAAKGKLPSKSVDVEDIDEDNFWCNDELYDFLANFVVESNTDVADVLKVIDGCANALIRHKKRTKEIRKRIEEEKRKLEEEKKAFLNIPGVSKALKSIKERAKSPPPGKRQAASALSSGSKPLFPISSTVSSAAPTPAPPKASLPLSFDSYRPPAPPANAKPSQPLRPQAKEAQHMPQPGPSGAAVNRPQGSDVGFQQKPQGSFKQTKPPINDKPPWPEQKPPSDQLRQTTDEPRPSANEFRRQEDDSRPPVNEPRSRFDSRPFVDEFGRQEDSRPHFDSRPPVNEYRRQEDDSRPPVNEPRSRFDSRPFVDEFRRQEDSRPPINEPRPHFDSRPSVNEYMHQEDDSRPPVNERRSRFDSRPFVDEFRRQEDSRPPINEPRPHFDSRPSVNEHRRQEDDSRLPVNEQRSHFDSRRFVDEFRQQEDSRPHFDLKPSENEFRRQEEEFRPPMNEPRSHFDSRPSANDFRRQYDSRPGFDSRPPFPKSGFDVSGPPDDSRSPSQGNRMPPYNQRLPPYEPRPRFSEQRPSHNEPRPPLNRPRIPFNDPRPPLNRPRPPFNEHTSPNHPRSLHGPSDRYQDDGYNHSERFPRTQFGPSSGPRSSYGSGRADESMDSYNQRYAESSYEAQGRPPPDSMRSSYNMHQGQWSSEMPPRDAFPPTGDGGRDGFPMNQGKPRFQ